MTYDEVIDKLVEQGAIRVYQISDGWGFAYRWQEGQAQARGFNRARGDGQQWQLRDNLVGADHYITADGWHAVQEIPHQAKPIERPAARQNPGYFAGLTRQCPTCKQVKPLSSFIRDEESFEGYRTWECNECYNKRKEELGLWQSDPERRVGDYVDRDTHASKPPVVGDV